MSEGSHTVVTLDCAVCTDTVTFPLQSGDHDLRGWKCRRCQGDVAQLRRAAAEERAHADRLAEALELIANRSPIAHFILKQAPGTGFKSLDDAERDAKDRDLERVGAFIGTVLREHRERRLRGQA